MLWDDFCGLLNNIFLSHSQVKSVQFLAIVIKKSTSWEKA
jgi:hypothetical protein